MVNLRSWHEGVSKADPCLSLRVAGPTSVHRHWQHDDDISENTHWKTSTYHDRSLPFTRLSTQGCEKYQAPPQGARSKCLSLVCCLPLSSLFLAYLHRHYRRS